MIVCSCEQNPAGGKAPGGPVHQPLQLLQLLHQPRVRLQRRHLLVCLLRRLHQQELPGTNEQIWIQHHSGHYQLCNAHLLTRTSPCLLEYFSFTLNPSLSSAAHKNKRFTCRSGMSLYLPSLLSTEPERMFLCISRERISHSASGEMSDARLPGGLPHLPVCGVCLQPGRSHGPDSLCHHPDQVFFPLRVWIHLGFSKNQTSILSRLSFQDCEP